ncbi:hypothetical protein JMA_32630 [Jeotgalibacillus malaysiensis]|uniref:Uncharacterized protein n=1 Tax=Jeotgalibacillus malaysiensis TaxID=1508404 RepID=A0A0B5AQN1_9BACL|nr:hypothetical protein [Jeotgalibacillus malaysiensis]AJD92580.1 hypothetical protein JMA_32630 [Jeotgalibacillus malaysiensis]
MNDQMVLGLVIVSAPKSLLTDEGFEHVKVFSAAELEEHFDVKGSLHFDRGEDNLLSGHGKAGFAYWTKLFALTEEEIEETNWDHNEALHLLIKKLRTFVRTHGLNVAKWHDFNVEFDFVRPWCVQLFTPASPPMLFNLGIGDMKWLASMEMEFSYWARRDQWMDLVMEAAEK